MIITLTANPSLDRTIELGTPLAHGAVQRAVGAVQDPGGKGVIFPRSAGFRCVDPRHCAR